MMMRRRLLHMKVSLPHCSYPLQSPCNAWDVPVSVCTYALAQSEELLQAAEPSNSRRHMAQREAQMRGRGTLLKRKLLSVMLMQRSIARVLGITVAQMWP